MLEIEAVGDDRGLQLAAFEAFDKRRHERGRFGDTELRAICTHQLGFVVVEVDQVEVHTALDDAPADAGDTLPFLSKNRCFS